MTVLDSFEEWKLCYSSTSIFNFIFGLLGKHNHTPEDMQVFMIRIHVPIPCVSRNWFVVSTGLSLAMKFLTNSMSQQEPLNRVSWSPHCTGPKILFKNRREPNWDWLEAKTVSRIWHIWLRTNYVQSSFFGGFWLQSASPSWRVFWESESDSEPNTAAMSGRGPAPPASIKHSTPDLWNQNHSIKTSSWKLTRASCCRLQIAAQPWEWKTPSTTDCGAMFAMLLSWHWCDSKY